MHYSRFRRTGTYDGRPLSDRCLQCVKPLVGRRAGTLYCSERCAARYRRRVDDKPITCLLCGTERVARSGAIFCSRRCTSRASAVRRLYGLEASAYRALLDGQGHACAVCRRGFAQVVPHVDHDHATGRVRGVLCSACNTSIGLLQEDRDRILALVAYLDDQPET